MLHKLLAAAAAWLAAHPVATIGYAAAALMALVSQLPARYAQLPVVGFAMRTVDWASVLAHKDEPGKTLTWPGVPSLVLRAAADVRAGRDRRDEIPPPPSDDTRKERPQ
jgi:hypothetical protein